MRLLQLRHTAMRWLSYFACCSVFASWGLVEAQKWQCDHCDVKGGFEEFLKPDLPASAAPYSSEVNVLWSTHVETIPITSDIGGWEPPEFHQRLAAEAISGWRMFKDKLAPKLKKGHPLRKHMAETHAGALNDAFFSWQKNLFEASGDMEQSLADEDNQPNTPGPEENTTWPQMNGLPEYNKLRRIVEKLSRRYLVRSGMVPSVAASLNYSIFNWAAVHGPGEFHGPHTHVGEFHVGVFYAQVGRSAGKLRFGDPRGHSPPFGRSYFHTPRSGDLVLFPSWLSHMATVTAPSSDIEANQQKDDEPLRVVFSFNIGPAEGPMPCHLWYSDPTGDMRFVRRSPIDPKELGL